MSETRARSLSILAFALALDLSAAQPSSPEGRWSGRIEVPGNPLDITVELAPDGEAAWRGTIDVPAQGLAGFPLSAIAAEATTVGFAMSGVPGEPTFRGELEDGGNALVGELSQGGAAFPFRLERTGESTLGAAARPDPPLPAEVVATLVGRWEGSLEIPGRPLRLALSCKASAGGGLDATLDSPDQDQTGLPVSHIGVDGDAIRVELTYMGAAFEAQLDEGGTALVGTWHQGGGSLPLTLRKVAGEPEAAFPIADPKSAGLPEGRWRGSGGSPGASSTTRRSSAASSWSDTGGASRKRPAP